MSGILATWRRAFRDKQRYANKGRDPFYLLAGEYLPAETDAIVVDVGAGFGRFAEILGLENRCDLRLLDGNPDTVARLARRYRNVQQYRAPEPLPFADGTVSFVHCSHLVEHLVYQDLYEFLTEIDRVLRPGGVLAVSTPLLWDGFYEDFSHVKPYGPGIFRNYFCQQSEQRSAGNISTSYRIENLTYRYAYRLASTESGLGSRFMLLDLPIQIMKKVGYWLGLRTYFRNGYTIVLRKG